MFIVIEGGDGVGKTTLIDNLKKVHPEYVYTKEPNFDDKTTKIRQIIDQGGLCNEAIAYLFASARAENTNKVILPAIKQGKVVISDRYVYSSAVYQGLLGGMGVDEVMRLNKWAMVRPDMVIVLKGKSHKNTSDNWLDELGQSDKVMRAFEILAGGDPDLFKLVDVTGLTPESVLTRVLELIEEK